MIGPSSSASPTARKISLAVVEALADTGDCLLWKGESFISWLIRQWTEYSHASLIVRLHDCEGRLYLVEAVLPEVEFRDALQRIRHADGEVYLFRPRWLNDAMRDCIVERAMDAVATGVRYDLKSLFKNALGYVSTDARAYFCSELVWDIWQKCGLAPSWALTAPRPGDIPRRIQGDLYCIQNNSS